MAAKGLSGWKYETAIGEVHAIPFITRQGSGILVKTVSKCGNYTGRLALSDESALALITLLERGIQTLEKYHNTHGHYSPPTLPLL